MITKKGSKTKSINLTPALIEQIENRANGKTFSYQVVVDLDTYYSLLDALSRTISDKFTPDEIEAMRHTIGGIGNITEGQAHLIGSAIVWHLEKPTMAVLLKKRGQDNKKLISKVQELSTAEQVALWDMVRR